MQKQFTLPGVCCEQCGGKLALDIETQRVSIERLKVVCTQCDWEEDILEKGSEKFEGSKEHLRKLSKELAKTLTKLRDTLPKNREEWGQVVGNPRHPFTATLLVGILIILMELSGFTVFLVVTWILGNLILNPVGWILVPLVVAIAFAYRRYFKRGKMKKLKEQLDELERRRDAGELSDEEFEAAKEELFSKYFQ
jgi:uncharacterized membrane protein